MFDPILHLQNQLKEQQQKKKTKMVHDNRTKSRALQFQRS
jgi:hypothetical protein